jgi:hypothetical protein
MLYRPVERLLLGRNLIHGAALQQLDGARRVAKQGAVLLHLRL